MAQERDPRVQTVIDHNSPRYIAQDALFPPRAAERLAEAVSGPCELVIEPNGNHGCFNVVYRSRPMMADWLVDRLRG